MRKGESGFSLLEMIIVLAVMGILAAVMVPGFGLITQRAKETSLKTVAHHLQLGLENYRLNHGGYPVGDYQGAGLSQLLQESQDLSQLPKNPFTGQSLQDGDGSGKLTYHSDGETYTLSGYGKGNQRIVMTLEGQ